MVDMVNSILFICTGNVFRSVVAEYALKTRLGPASPYEIGSAGTEALPHPIPTLIHHRLLEKGADPSQHVQRRLTQELLERTDLVVAMGLNHREFIRRHFRREALLFNQVCFQREEPVWDVHEAVPQWDLNVVAARDYMLSVIDYLWDAMPAFLARLPHFSLPLQDRVFDTALDQPQTYPPK
jgi:protein-tyrosine phosphatase